MSRVHCLCMYSYPISDLTVCEKKTWWVIRLFLLNHPRNNIKLLLFWEYNKIFCFFLVLLNPSWNASNFQEEHVICNMGNMQWKRLHAFYSSSLLDYYILYQVMCLWCTCVSAVYFQSNFSLMAVHTLAFLFFFVSSFFIIFMVFLYIWTYGLVFPFCIFFVFLWWNRTHVCTYVQSPEQSNA